ncbi:MAG: SLC13 family permease [Liquorilactobacillus nagelii]|jgi:di/tricarboxylate transporter|uniref:SLC13 family permease n=1 Tax=Liquorilactobacillus nagelii TaxID=82688 RepID=UPI00242C1E61|nr:SLC13 family permease [Liquorilactobacillus nagelii]MCI1633219.1 SLC13 family permease [Liquorilactobacillus nagelii]MCI1921103.1 SLC13 family permease [Liquorilactobacillus nagelii]MCI1975705.1 SLC13 family permease [Liquorilactobacillus nagelii]
MNSILIGLSLLAAIILGRKKKINIGIAAIPFAYIVGTFFVKMLPEKVIEGWPLATFFVILGISIFFGFATANGTLEVLANNILYRFRSFPLVLPIIIFLIAVLIAALGAGYYAVMVLMAPMAIIICNKLKINPLIGALAADCGGQVGSNFMIGLNGVVFRNLITSEGYSADLAFSSSISIFVVYFVMTFLIILGLMFFSIHQKRAAGIDDQEEIEFALPKKYTKAQKTNLVLIAIFVVVLLLPPFAHMAFPKSSVISFLNSSINVGLVAILFALISFLLNLSTEKEVLSKIPWGTLLMISGMGMLVNVAINAGTIKILSGWMNHVPSILIPLALCLLASLFNSFGGSFIGVVAPALFPVVASIAHSTGINPILLYTCVAIGGLATGISPFSSGGAMVLGFVKEDFRDEMYKREFYVGLPLCITVAAVTSLIYYAIMG